ncbi:sensor histidine kinase [bacterium]|nr:sensor histidine kinase [bacterium]
MRLHQRLGERDFWLVQAGVFGVTIVHTMLEVWQSGPDPSTFYEGARHLPVVAYAIPVAFASLRYGIEGGLLTGALVVALALPNVLTAHLSGFGWIGELATVLFVVAVGLVVAVVVEREQQSRIRAEESARRLALLGDVAASFNYLPDPRLFLRAVLDELIDALQLDSAAFRGVDESWPTVARRSRREGSERATGPGDDPVVGFPPGEGLIAIPVAAGGELGKLVVSAGDAVLNSRDLELLASVAEEMGLALENARLNEMERTMRRDHVQAVTRAQEEERKRVSRELHDEANTLVGLSRGLDRLKRHLEEGGSDTAAIEDLRSLAVSGIDGMRRVSRDLRPPMLDDLGLIPALEWLVGRVGKHGEEQVRLEVAGSVRRLPSEVELAAFRIVQEALNNIVKHAAATVATVAIVFGDGRFEARIEDDGCGLDERARSREAAFGLVGMRERADLVGGEVTITSLVGTGTAVAFSVMCESDSI